MSWAKLLADNKIKAHKPSLAEINSLHDVIERDLKDAALTGLSTDRSFATAYNAALQTAQMIILCSGYRLASVPGHHKTAFEAVPLAMGKSAQSLAAYFETCRRKRNLVDYDKARVASDTEANELLTKATGFLALTEKWIKANHPQLSK